MPPRKSSKFKIFTYDELIVRKRLPRKPFFMLMKEYEKLRKRKGEFESMDRNKLPKGFDLRKEKLRVNTLLKHAKPMRGDSLALYQIVQAHQRSKRSQRSKRTQRASRLT